MRMFRRISPAVLFFAAFLAAELPARAQINTVDLSVTVTDPQGQRVPNATVSAKNLATGQSRAAKGAEPGLYVIVGLPPGDYELSVAATGFATLVNPHLALTVGQAASYDAVLQIQSGVTTVTVSDTTALVETLRTSVAQTVTSRQIEDLPINGRNYINFTLLNSEATRDSAPSIGAAPTSGINFSGQRARSNEVSVDGADAVDNSTDGIRSTVSQEAVQEFQIIVSNYMPEFGRAMGGVVNIVTKSGSNSVHGNVFGFFRHKDLQARNPFSVQVDPVSGQVTAVKQPFTRIQAGATLGGPIQKDKTFYFLSYETTRRHETGFTNIGTNNFDLVPTTTPVVPGVTLLLTPAQRDFVNNPAVLGAPGGVTLAQEVFALAGSASNVALTGIDPGLVAGGFLINPPFGPGPARRFPLPIDCSPSQGVFCNSSNLVPLPSSFVPLKSLIGNYPISEGTSISSARLDHQWNDRNNTFVRASVTPSTVTGIQVNAQNENFGQNAGSRTSVQTFRDLSIVGQHSTSLGGNLFNEFRFQFARRGLHYGFSQLPGGSLAGINITGFAFFGREPFSTVDRIERRWQWSDNLSWIKGNHTFKVGSDTNLVQIRSSKSEIFELNFGGVYDFGALSASDLSLPSNIGAVPVPGFTAVQSYGLGLPNVFIQGIGNSNRPFDNPTEGFFVQDSWKVTPRLTLNYGVRYDIEFTPTFKPGTALNQAAEPAMGVMEGIPRDTNNWAPRFGLAFDPKGDGKTVIRAGYGIFYDHPLLAVAFNSTTADGALSSQLLSGGGTPTRASVATDPAALNAGSIFQGVLNAIPSMGYLPNQQRFDATLPDSLFTNQNFITAGLPIPLLPFTLPVARDFVFAYAQQGNLTIERQLGNDYKISASYTYAHGVHLNRPRDINTPDPTLLMSNLRNALAAGLSFSNPLTVVAPSTNVAPTAGTCGVFVVAPAALGALAGCPGPLAALDGQFIGTASFFNFFRPSGPNPSFQGLAGGYQNQVALAQAAGYPLGFGVPVAWTSVDQQESSGNSLYNGLTVSLSKRFSRNFELLSSWTYSHTIDDSTDLQTLLQPQDNRNSRAERSSSTFDQRHRWVTSMVFLSPFKRNDDGWYRKFLADFTVAPIIELASGRPYTVLTGTDYNFDLGANTDRPSVASSGGVTSPYLPSSIHFLPPNVCDSQVSLGPVSLSPPGGCTGNLGRNAFIRPWFTQTDLRISRKFYPSEKWSIEFIADGFNMFNRFNVGDVNPLCDPTNASACLAGQPTAALDQRQFQLALKVSW